MGGNKFWSVVQSIFSAPRHEITDFFWRYRSDAATILSDFNGSDVAECLEGRKGESGSSFPLSQHWAGAQSFGVMDRLTNKNEFCSSLWFPIVCNAKKGRKGKSCSGGHGKFFRARLPNYVFLPCLNCGRSSGNFIPLSCCVCEIWNCSNRG